jgi:D-alanyl-D-alanine dipeptidase
VWAVLYAAVQTTWAATGATVPLAAGVAYAPGGHAAFAALAVISAGAALAGLRTRGARGRRAVGAILAAGAAVFTLGMTSLPMHAVTLVSGSGVESGTGLAHVLMNACGAGLLLMAGTAHRRRSRGRCPRCGTAHPGRADGPLVHPRPSTASVRTRAVVYLLMCGLLPWAGVKTVWTLGGDALGVTARGWAQAVETGASPAVRALAALGIDVTVLFALLGCLLMCGLLYPWGQALPRWLPSPAAGRRVPRMLPLVPAWLTAAGLSVYGVLLTAAAPLMAAGVLPAVEPSAPFTTAAGPLWMVAFGGLAFSGLGVGLAAAARSYAARTRPVCAAA